MGTPEGDSAQKRNISPSKRRPTTSDKPTEVSRYEATCLYYNLLLYYTFNVTRHSVEGDHKSFHHNNHTPSMPTQPVVPKQPGLPVDLTYGTPQPQAAPHPHSQHQHHDGVAPWDTDAKYPGLRAEFEKYLSRHDQIIPTASQPEKPVSFYHVLWSIITTQISPVKKDKEKKKKKKSSESKQSKGKKSTPTIWVP
jgi:hypothetical protein